MQTIRVVALCWLILLGAWFYGIRSVEYRLWPYPVLEEIEAFLAGDEEEDTTLAQKVQNDFGLIPARHLVDAPGRPYEDDRYRLPDNIPLSSRRQAPMLYLGDNAARGYRAIYGVFDFDRTLHGVILIDADGEIVNIWQTSQQDVDWDHLEDANVFPHGFGITPDGSILVAYDRGSSLTKYDYCGNMLWRLKGGFHHSIELGDDGTFWSWGSPGAETESGIVMHQVDTESGEIVRSIDIGEMILANPRIDIFGIRQFDRKEGASWVMEGGGPFHHNDVDPLPVALAPYYPDFDAGDLLVSFRSINLIFVLDPETVEVKWWRIGATRRQHDPDWNRNGTITILNNNMHRGFSHIMELDPSTMKSKRLLDGREHNFYTWHRGKHQRYDDGTLLVTSADQGRVFEVNPQGQVTFDFQNIYTPQLGALAVSEARFLPEDYFVALPQCKQ